ncbi:unnamed protein product [Pleuronectes platessa]|uniref:Uncharacterized protein n=1 Tax=Pleuronectes platessa TaxID=8262 RepID=A0A9N7Z5J8_PLEPL|nr:unnamed protein product [Pleuronectes platessa]
MLGNVQDGEAESIRLQPVDRGPDKTGDGGDPSEDSAAGALHLLTDSYAWRSLKALPSHTLPRRGELKGRGSLLKESCARDTELSPFTSARREHGELQPLTSAEDQASSQRAGEPPTERAAEPRRGEEEEVDLLKTVILSPRLPPPPPALTPQEMLRPDSLREEPLDALKTYITHCFAARYVLQALGPIQGVRRRLGLKKKKLKEGRQRRELPEKQRSPDPVLIILTFKRFDSDGAEIL